MVELWLVLEEEDDDGMMALGGRHIQWCARCHAGVSEARVVSNEDPDDVCPSTLDCGKEVRRERITPAEIFLDLPRFAGRAGSQHGRHSEASSMPATRRRQEDAAREQEYPVRIPCVPAVLATPNRRWMIKLKLGK